MRLTPYILLLEKYHKMVYNEFMWVVELTRKAVKQQAALPERIRLVLQVLMEEIRAEGPFRASWRNYSKLSDSHYHCHLKRGQPTYVACW